MSALAPGAADVVRPPPADVIEQAGERRSARIESVRALAALAVVACHAWGFSTPARFDTFHSRLMLGLGFLGVVVFFTLSGYLIYRPFARRDFGDGQPVRVGRYARNRAVRILPLYYVVLTVVVIVDGTTFTEWLRFALFGENFRGATVAQAVDGPMWSLVVELHFYLLLPLVAWAIARLSRGSAATAAIVLLLLGAAAVLVYELQSSPLWVYNLPVNFVYFVPGMLLALATATGWDHRLRGRRHPLLHGDLWMVAAVVLWVVLYTVTLPMELRLLPLAACGSLLVVGAVVLPVRTGLARILDLRVLAAIGVASYSLYLWHWPVMHWLPHGSLGSWGAWLRFLLYALPVCLIVSAVSYRTVEAPALRLRRQWSAATPATD